MDNAIPSGTSSLVHCFSSLYALTNDSKYIEKLISLSCCYSALAQKVPNGVPYALAGLVSDAIGVATIKTKGAGNIEALQDELSRKPWRRTFLLQPDEHYQPASYQLCIGTQCLDPTDDIEEIVNHL